MGSSVSPNSDVLPGAEAPVGRSIAVNLKHNCNDFLKASATGGHRAMLGNLTALRSITRKQRLMKCLLAVAAELVRLVGVGRASVQGNAAACGRCSIRELFGKLVAPESVDKCEQKLTWPS